MRAEGRKEGERGLRRGFLGGAEGMEGGQAWLPGCGSDSKRNVHVFVFILANESVVLVAVLVVMCVKKGAENWLFE